jgi:hypothetical protein
VMAACHFKAPSRDRLPLVGRLPNEHLR